VIFAVGRCLSCHAPPKAEGADKQLLTGGRPFRSDFGTFYAPNISLDPEQGIGSWSLDQLARAVTKGVSPNGAQYDPAFPYTTCDSAGGEMAGVASNLAQLPASDREAIAAYPKAIPAIK